MYSLDACRAWNVTQTCADAAVLWATLEFATYVTWAGSTLLVPPGIGTATVGCWEGPVVLQHMRLEPFGLSEPREFVMGPDPGRFMEVDCVAGDCTQPVCEEE